MLPFPYPLVDSILWNSAANIRCCANTRVRYSWNYQQQSVSPFIDPLGSREPLNVSPTPTRCIAMGPTTRVVGALSLWSIEVVMQMRIYALYKCSRKVDIFVAQNWWLSMMLDFVGVGSGDQLHAVPHLHCRFSLGAGAQCRAPSSYNCQRDSSATSRLSHH